MKIRNVFQLFQRWEIVVMFIIVLFSISAIIFVIIPDLTASVEQNIVVENTQKDEEKFEIVGVIPDTTRWVKFSGEDGGGLYTCITSAGEIYEIQKNSGGRISSKTSTQGESFDYIYEFRSDSENICLKEMLELSNEVQAGIHRGIYWADVSAG